MAFTIPISSLAGPLAVSFTVAAPESVPVQSPQRPAETAPATDLEPEPEPARTTSGPPALPDAPGEVAAPPSPPPTEAPAPAMQPLPPPAQAPAPLMADEVHDALDPAPPAPQPKLLQPTDKRGFFSLSAGGATENGYASYYGGSGVGFNLEMIVGRYGKRRPNLGGAFVLQYRKGLVSEIGLAGRFRARKRLTKEFALYTVFDTTFGLNVPIAIGGYLYPSIPSAQLGVGWGLEAILAERVTLGLRPFAPSIVAPNFFGGYPVGLRWDFGVSLGVVW